MIIGAAAVLLVAGLLYFQTMNTPATDKQNENNAIQNDVETMPGEENVMDKKTIVEIAAADENFSTLVTAVTTAGLTETLSGTGPFTVFAPTNEAFAKLPEGTVEGLLKDKDALTKILTYHVVSGKVMAADVVGLKSATTVQGQDLQITAEEGKVKINGANVVQTDIEASNGVIHVVDTVLLPK